MNGLIELGQYNGVTIEARPADQLIDATSMCKANGKLWGHYWSNQQAQEFLTALSMSIGIPIDQIVQTVSTGPNRGRGTWVHRRVAIHLAQWCSPEFAVWVTGRIEELFLTGRSVIHREHTEAALAQIVGERISGQLVGMESRFNVRLDKQDSKIDAVCREVQKVSNAVAGKREDFSSDVVKAANAAIKAFPFHDRCPICGDRQTSALHHWLGKGGRDPKYCLPLCQSCHDLITENYDLHETSEWRDAYNRFQKRLQCLLKEQRKYGKMQRGRRRVLKSCASQRRLEFE